jgi:hypothetical protein
VKKYYISTTILIVLSAIFLLSIIFNKDTENISINNFEECVAMGYRIIESYPEQCISPKKTFTKDIGNELEKIDLIMIESPRPNMEIQSPFLIKGVARGYWYFEASFPIRLFDANGKEIALAIATAKSDWMTTEFVSFEAILEFDKPDTKSGVIVFEKDNPSDLRDNDDYLIMPIVFSE